MSSSWFPRPVEEDDIVLLEPSGTWTPSAVRDSLLDEHAAEWRHKVGVAGPLDGSARSTTRLLAHRGWVFKSRVDTTFPSPRAGRLRLLAARALGRSAGLWHPEKTWGLVRSNDAWYPLTICRELVTLRQIPRFEDRLAAWLEMIQTGIDVDRLHGLGLDVNPSNFARQPGAQRLFYVDDDLYPRLDRANLGGAIAARLPEEPGATETDWRRWGETLRADLVLGPWTWDELRDEIRSYPLPERFHSSREALLSPLERRSYRPSIAETPRRTCVLADVHGNLAALDAVLTRAAEMGATDFLFLGDAVGYGPKPRECIDRLQGLPAFLGVRGNHDHAIATGRLDVGMNSLARECAEWTRSQLSGAELAWLGALPVEQSGETWLAVHGAPKDPQRFLAYVYELTYEDNLRHLRDHRIPVCFFGHTHVQLTHVELAGGPSKLAGPRSFQLTPQCCWLVNPGSVGQPRDGDSRAAFGIWDHGTNHFTALRAPYDIELTLAAQRKAGLSERLDRRLVAGT